jgi:hypothetical protein
MPSDESDHGGEPAENRISKSAAKPPHWGPRQKSGGHFTDESLR